MERSAIDELDLRGLVDNLSNRDGIAAYLREAGGSFYVGYDPTAASLHVGHLLPIITMARLQRMGLRPIVLVGGATGAVGDPSGRETERSMLTQEQLIENKAQIARQLGRFVDFTGNCAAVMVDNGDWIGPITLLEWLRDVGKLFTVNYMLSKESVRRRLEDRDQGISYTEFSYMLLQAFDFLHLFEAHGCRLQAGGSDQWGNITAGIDLVRKVHGEEVFGLTLPLLTTPSGEKFGKSAGNAIWLDPDQTSPYRFYQFWVNQPDAEVVRLLRLFTFLALEDIESVSAEHRANPEARIAQRALAREVTEIVHGDEAAGRAERTARALFSGHLAELDASEVADVLAEAPASTLRSEDIGKGMAIVDVLVAAGVVSSKSEARRLVEGGGVYVNDDRVDATRVVGSPDVKEHGHVLIRTGKRRYHVIRVE